MKKNIILAGVGGQGILSIAAVIDWAALKSGFYIKQAEVHGMSQRGGAVQSHLRISDQPVYSDLIPLDSADIILSVEPMEALRYLPYLAEDGHIVTSVNPLINIPDYPEIDTIINELKETNNPVLVNSKNIAREIKNNRANNIIMLGAGAAYTGIKPEQLEEGIKALFARKGEAVINSNIEAFRKGQAEYTRQKNNHT